MWLTGDSEVVKSEHMGKNDNASWLADTIKSAVATSAAVMMAAGIAKIQDYVVNIGVPAQSRLGDAPNSQTHATTQDSWSKVPSSLRDNLLTPY